MFVLIREHLVSLTSLMHEVLKLPSIEQHEYDSPEKDRNTEMRQNKEIVGFQHQTSYDAYGIC